MKTNQKQKNIPDDWEIKKLGEICTFRQGVQIPYNEQVEVEKEGYVRYLYIRDFFTDKYPYYIKDKYPNKIIQKEDLMMVNTGNTAGKVYSGSFGVLSNNAFKIVLNKKKINRDFLFNYIASEKTQAQIQRYFNLGGQPHVGHKNVALVPVPVPPIPEQNRIVSVLETWDTGIEKLKKKIAIKKEIKKGLMQELLTGKKRLPEFSDKWQDFKFGKCLITLKKPNGLKSSDYNNVGYPIFDQSDNKYISGYTHDEQFILDYSFENSVILFGDHSRTIKYINQKAAFGNDGIKLFQGNKISDTRFMYYRLLIQEVPNTGYNRHFKYLKDEIFSLPKIEEQNAIASILISSDQEIEVLKNKLKYFQDQKKYLLNNLVTGQIRTPESLNA
jgi:type I restriction enzyme S subunit